MGEIWPKKKDLNTKMRIGTGLLTRLGVSAKLYMFRVVVHMIDMCRNTIDEFLSRLMSFHHLETRRPVERSKCSGADCAHSF